MRLTVLQSLDKMFDRYLCQPELVDYILLFLNDSDLTVFICTDLMTRFKQQRLKLVEGLLKSTLQ